MNRPITVGELEAGVRAMADMQRRMEGGEWVLMSPQGDVWIGPPQNVMRALVTNAPIDQLLAPLATGKDGR